MPASAVTPLHYEVTGEGEWLVLIHGNTLDLRMWDDQLPAFSRHYRVLRYDLRGFGRSPLPGAQPYSHAQDLRNLLQHLGCRRAHILCSSMGGRVAVDFTLTFPDMVDRLITVDANLDGYVFAETPPAALATSVARSEGVAAARSAWLAHPMFAPVLRHTDAGWRVRDMVEAYSAWHWINDDPHQPLTPSAIERLESIIAPTLVVAGTEDVYDFRRIADVLAARIPNADKTLLPGIGHMPNMEAPATVNDLVLDFLG